MNAKDFTPAQADAWIKQEFGKIKTKTDASNFLASYAKSDCLFFATEAGIASGLRMPNARNARHKLSAMVQEKIFPES
jgi:hypothetical protein